MSANGYRMTTIDGRKSVTILFNNEWHMSTEDSDGWQSVCEALLEKDFETAAKLCSPESALKESIKKSSPNLTSRIQVENGQVVFDGEICNDAITDHIMHLVNNGLPFVPLANFYAKLANNPVHHARNQLFDWLTATGAFTLDNDGNLIGYKGVNDDLSSVNSGPGWVNGKYCNGHLDNTPGNKLAIDDVQMDPSIGCSHGLHVGTWDYAHGFGSRTLSVRVDPADVVSVPTDCGAQKCRVSKYEVIEEVNQPYEEGVL